MNKIYWWTQSTTKASDFELEYELMLNYKASNTSFKFFYKDESSWYYVKRVDNLSILSVGEGKCQIYGEIRTFDKKKFFKGHNNGWRFFTCVSFNKDSITKVQKL